ncbi:MAG: hypothetical protein AABZ00_08005 [Chloroflexota bacterium]|mgnify:CR=1 FL=1
MPRYKPIIYIGLAILLILAFISFRVITSPNRTLTTPDLIQRAVANGKITEEERLLYLAYALGDYEKLPTRFHSNAPWSGTLIILELREVSRSKSVMCELSPFVQGELRRIFHAGVICEK